MQTFLLENFIEFIPPFCSHPSWSYAFRSFQSYLAESFSNVINKITLNERSSEEGNEDLMTFVKEVTRSYVWTFSNFSKYRMSYLSRWDNFGVLMLRAPVTKHPAQLHSAEFPLIVAAYDQLQIDTFNCTNQKIAYSASSLILYKSSKVLEYRAHRKNGNVGEIVVFLAFLTGHSFTLTRCRNKACLYLFTANSATTSQ